VKRTSGTSAEHVGQVDDSINGAAPFCILCAAPLAIKYDFGARALWYCAACRLGQLAPLPTEDELMRLYASRSYFEGSDGVGYADYTGDAPQLARTFRAKLDQLLQFGRVQDLLEIGCGPGLFLTEARAAGIAGAVGVDRNPWAIAEARRRGLEAHVGSIQVLPPERTFDAVVMLDLLEHVTTPLAFLAAVRQRLRPGGRLFIMTPNIRSLLARISGARWVSFKIPEHVFYYSPRSLRTLLDRCGFDVIAARGTGQFVTVEFLFNRLRRLAPRLTRACELGARALRLNARVVFVTNGSTDVVARARTPAGLPAESVPAS
jgi:SAM-dependent methyltransferase